MPPIPLPSSTASSIEANAGRPRRRCYAGHHHAAPCRRRGAVCQGVSRAGAGGAGGRRTAHRGISWHYPKTIRASISVVCGIPSRRYRGRDCEPRSGDGPAEARRFYGRKAMSASNQVSGSIFTADGAASSFSVNVAEGPSSRTVSRRVSAGVTTSTSTLSEYGRPGCV